MNATLNKISTYIGFAAKARKIIYGFDNIKLKDKKGLIIVCSTVGENTKAKVMKFVQQKNLNCVILTDITLEEILKKKNCKIIAIQDKNLAKAIIDNHNAYINRR